MDATELSRVIEQLSQFEGHPAGFWQQFCQQAAQLLSGKLAVVYAQESSGQGWRTIASWPTVEGGDLPTIEKTLQPKILQQVAAGQVVVSAAPSEQWQLVSTRVWIESAQQLLVLVIHTTLSKSVLEDSGYLLQLTRFSQLPTLYEVRRKTRSSERDATRLAQAIEVLGRVSGADRFDQAALVLSNELAERFACETVSLCWRSRGGLRLESMSHAERVDRRTELSALLEEAGEEALVQRSHILWPEKGRAVSRAHARYAELQHPGHLLTIPLFQQDQHFGTVTLERQRMGFTAAEQWALGLICELALPLLKLLQQYSRMLPVRIGREVARSMPAWMKPLTQSGRRVVTLLVGLVVGILISPFPYSVDANAIVKTDAMAFIGAPFDGYLATSQVSLGSTVEAGDVLFSLATQELSMERTAVLADIAQYSREVEKRRSQNQLSEMQVAEAQVEQSTAELAQIDYRLEHAVARSPIDGVVVEGEPGKSLGGAVRRGDTVVKVAALKQLYVEAAVPETELSHIEIGQEVRLTLLAVTGETYFMSLTRIVPAASVQDGANTFPVRVESDDFPPQWWRPGMSGVAKISVGWKPLGWILTHRLIDYLRVVFWI